MDDLISVIVPVYNVEKYLRRCVESILAQSYQNIEVILVDDGSTDQSGSICDEFANRDNRVKVIHKPNGGVSDARNVGNKAVSGGYVTFCDSDDWMESTILENALLIANTDDADIVVWGYSADFVDNDEKLLTQVDYVPNKAICQKGQDNKILASDLIMGLIGYVWNKLYKVDLIKGMSFKHEMTLYEDILYNAGVFINSQKVAFLDEPGTHYIQRDRETLGTKFYSNFFELKLCACQAREEILKSFGFTNKGLFNAMSSHYLGSLEAVVRMASRSRHFSSNSERKRYLRTVFEQETAKTILNMYRPHGYKGKLIYVLMRLRAYSIMIWLFQLKIRRQ